MVVAVIVGIYKGAEQMIDIRCSRDGLKCEGCPIIKECEHIELTEEVDAYSLYEKGRADAIDEHFRKIMSFINTNNRGSCDYFIVDQIENYIAEQLKEQMNDN